MNNTHEFVWPARTPFRHGLSALLLTLLISFLSHADVTPNPLFQDNMVLQRDKPIAIWGTADAGESVSVSLADTSASTTADADGQWRLFLDPISADGIPHLLTFEGNNTVTLRNILLGDVYIGSGQSNMSLTINDLAADLTNTLMHANYPEIRLLSLFAKSASEPRDEIPRGYWNQCDSASVNRFSALLYFFGQDLYKQTGVPIGLIQATFGGSYLHQWHPDLPDLDDASIYYNALIHPLMPFTVSGILWYQGESDGGSSTRSALYGERYLELIQLWRAGFNQPELPFFCTQLANYEWGNYGLIRNGHYQSMSLTNVGCTTAVDLGDTYDIHPRTKETLGPRFSLWIRKFLYGHDVAFTGPLWKSATVVDNVIEVTFAYVGTGLVVAGETIAGFELAGADENYVDATVELISTNTVRVSSADISNPQWVRYAWASDPAITLYGSDELPALPFLAEAGTTGPMPSFSPSLVNTNILPPKAEPAPHSPGSVIVDLPFNEGSGSSAIDQSSYGNHATISGAVWTNGYTEQALSFDSSDDRVDCLWDSSLDAENFTAAAWIKLDATGSRMNLFSRMISYSGWKFMVDRDGPLCLAWWDDESNLYELNAISSLSTNTWYHVAVAVENGGTVTFYVNGQPDGASTMSSHFSYFDAPLVIGNSDTGWYGGHLIGALDDAFFCNQPLTASQMLDLANGTPPKPIELMITHQEDDIHILATNLSARATNRLQLSTNLVKGIWQDYSTFTGTTATNWLIPRGSSGQQFRILSE